MVEQVRSLLHKTSTGTLIINLRRIIRQKRSLKRYTDEECIRMIYKKKVGRELNLEHPERFTEKLQWIKLYYHNPIMTVCVDKIAVRDFLDKLGYGDLLMPIVGSYRNVKEIPFHQLPARCIFKASHGSSMHLVKKESQRSIPLMWKLIMESWLHMNIYIEGREWPYKDVKPGIICEEFVEAKTERRLKDYKFFCFNGRPEFVQVDVDLLKDHHINFYDMEWELLPLRCQYPNSESEISKPINYDKMIEVASKLSSPFPHVRIDFYEFDDVLKIGEMTFFDGSGFYSFHPDEYDYIFGDKLLLPEPFI